MCKINDDKKLEDANNQFTPEATLVALSSDNNWAVRRAVAENHSTPEATLALLASDYVQEVRIAVASNHSNTN